MAVDRCSGEWSGKRSRQSWTGRVPTPALGADDRQEDFRARSVCRRLRLSGCALPPCSTRGGRELTVPRRRGPRRVDRGGRTVSDAPAGLAAASGSPSPSTVGCPVRRRCPHPSRSPSRRSPLMPATGAARSSPSSSASARLPQVRPSVCLLGTRLKTRMIIRNLTSPNGTRIGIRISPRGDQCCSEASLRNGQAARPGRHRRPVDRLGDRAYSRARTALSFMGPGH